MPTPTKQPSTPRFLPLELHLTNLAECRHSTTLKSKSFQPIFIGSLTRHFARLEQNLRAVMPSTFENFGTGDQSQKCIASRTTGISIPPVMAVWHPSSSAAYVVPSRQDYQNSVTVMPRPPLSLCCAEDEACGAALHHSPAAHCCVPVAIGLANNVTSSTRIAHAQHRSSAKLSFSCRG